MLTIEHTLAGDHLIVGSRRIKADEDGDFIVPRPFFGDEDLSGLPAEVTIIIDNSKMPGRSKECPDRVHGIETLPMGRVSVSADYFVCPCCWTHSLDFTKYQTAVIQLLQKEAETNSGFHFEGTDLNHNHEPLQCFSIEVGVGAIADIERRVHDAITQILKPLNDIRDEIDQRMQQAFSL